MPIIAIFKVEKFGRMFVASKKTVAKGILTNRKRRIVSIRASEAI